MRLTPLLTLTKAAEFQAVRAQGAAWHTPNFILSWRRREDDLRRLGFIVTKKTGNAVERNRIKRRLRPLLRETLPDCAPAGDYVVIGKNACLDADAQTLKKDLLWALKKLSFPAS